MAERRMFAKSIVRSDAFLDMPPSARDLYYNLGLEADDDGFVGSPKCVIRQCGASQDDLAILLQKRFVLGFECGAIVITHWRTNNQIRSDRYRPTIYLKNKSTLAVDETGAYFEIEDETSNVYDVDTAGIPMVDKRYTQYSIGKGRIGEESIVEVRPGQYSKGKDSTGDNSGGEDRGAGEGTLSTASKRSSSSKPPQKSIHDIMADPYVA